MTSPRSTPQNAWGVVPGWFKYIWARWKWRKAMRAFAKQIAEARARHKAIRHIEQARQDFVHSCLRAEGRG